MPRRYVPGRGPREARIAIVGEQPGKTEVMLDFTGRRHNPGATLRQAQVINDLFSVGQIRLIRSFDCLPQTDDTYLMETYQDQTQIRRLTALHGSSQNCVAEPSAHIDSNDSRRCRVFSPLLPG